MEDVFHHARDSNLIQNGNRHTVQHRDRTEKTSSPQIPLQQDASCPTHCGLMFYRESAVSISQCFPPITNASLCLSDMPKLTDADGPWWRRARLPACLMSLPMGKATWHGRELWLWPPADLPRRFVLQAQQPEERGRFKTTSEKRWQSKKLIFLSMRCSGFVRGFAAESSMRKFSITLVSVR